MDDPGIQKLELDTESSLCVSIKAIWRKMDFIILQAEDRDRAHPTDI